MIVSDERPPLQSTLTGAQRHRVLLVEDHPIFRHGLKQLIESEPDLTVCAEADSTAHALSKLREVASDAAIIDISLPGTNGIELLKHIKAEHPKLPVLVVSAHDEEQYALRALRAGASGYVMKREAADVLVAALRRVLTGQVYVSKSFGAQLIFRTVKAGENGAASPLDTLSDRELEVLELIGQGKSSRDMADALHLSVKTIESHRLHIKEKLGCKSAPEMVRFACHWVAQRAGR
jgi:DNA-binding NarL/FixJ family response regulator